MKMCIVCHQETDTKIVIKHCAICYDCEQVMVVTDVDHPFYPLFVEQLKAINVM